jgi:hypothetical protein
VPEHHQPTYLGTRSTRADLAVAAIRQALRDPSDQAAMTAIADLLQAQLNQIDAVQLPAGASQGAP